MTAGDLRTEIAAHPEFRFVPVWIGELNGQLRAIVEEVTLHRLYLWPELTAWRMALPGETIPAIAETKRAVGETKRGQLSLF